MPERAGQAMAQQQAKQRHPGLEQPERQPDTQPGPGIDTVTPIAMAAAKLDRPRDTATSRSASIGHHPTKQGWVRDHVCRHLSSRALPEASFKSTGLRRELAGWAFSHRHGAPLRRAQTKRSAVMAERAIYRYVPHHRTQQKLAGDPSSPVKVADQLPSGSAAARFNAWFAVKVTSGVGTMWCAYAFAALALVSLPEAITSHSAVTLVSWISQTFLQLVLLSVIIVGQNVLAAAADKRSEATYNDADAVLHEAVKIQEHLAAQDNVLSDLIDKAQTQPG
jgi:hypothetical protein